jgi:hypothetical protein
MTYFPNFRTACLQIAFAAMALAFSHVPALPQAVDCGGLQAQIAALEHAGDSRSNRNGGATQRQHADLDRAVGYARSLRCDQPQLPFFGNPTSARCPGLNAQIQQMQANLGQLQAAGGLADRAAARVDLIARFNAYCRGQVQAPAQSRQRGFFEQLFGDLNPASRPNMLPAPGSYEEQSQSDEEQDHTPHGGSQAVCVRGCDGGFFPLNYSARRDPDQLNDLCQALCPNASVRVYTRSPNKEIGTAVSLDGEAYSEMPNALKFQKTFDPACTCKPAGQSWVDALAGAERALGHERKGDILVTQEKSAELSAPRSDTRTRIKEDIAPSSIWPTPSTSATVTKETANSTIPLQPSGQVQEIVGPDGVKRRVRIVGPTL